MRTLHPYFQILLPGIVFCLLLIGCSPNPPKSKVTGLWQLHIMEQQDSTGHWHEYNDGLQGMLLYDGQGHAALHLLPKDYADTDIDFIGTIDLDYSDSVSYEELRHKAQSYVYIARYEVVESEGIIKHTRLTASNPDDWGKTVDRKYSFLGDTLVLQPAEEDLADLRLKWVRFVQD